ncbi:hypothetical protein N8T08_008917 [Aspergillus melleus]|uniref:Uncharacterized protein n=1 Tax=Aspergillus melleus TaxID=138277 RepID=A0ACC3AUU8_9EURO|nr:hypothetical protein N8T08_008917 [Aspergillus melleus]
MATNVPNGKLYRGLSVPETGTIGLERELLEKEFREMSILGWLVEMLQANLLILDDIMGEPTTRREAFSHHPSYLNMVESFQEIGLLTESDQENDELATREPGPQKWTLEHYENITLLKGGYYSFYLSVLLCLQYLNIATPLNIKQTETVLIPLWQFYQVQTDYLDISGDSARKISMLSLANFRDVGGFPVSSTRCVRQSTIFRSANPRNLHQMGFLKLHDTWGIRVFDLRHSTFDDLTHRTYMAGLIPVFSAPAVEASNEIFLQGYFDLLLTDPVGALSDLYMYIFDSAMEGFRVVFNFLRGNPYKAFLVNCEVGKDRTEVFIAVVLLVLGVSDTDIIEDFRQSEKGIANLVRVRKKKMREFLSSQDVSAHLNALDMHFSYGLGMFTIVGSYIFGVSGLRKRMLSLYKTTCFQIYESLVVKVGEDSTEESAIFWHIVE